MCCGQDQERGKLLSDIRLGAQLKHVPWPTEKKAGEVEVTNVESELRHMVQKRRRKEVIVSKWLQVWPCNSVILRNSVIFCNSVILQVKYLVSFKYNFCCR